MNSRKLWTRLFATTVLTAAIAAPGYAQAVNQTDSPQADSITTTPDRAVMDDSNQDDRSDVIVVTGSRIGRPEVESTSPLVMTSDEEVTLSGFTRIEEVLNNLPQVEAAQTAFLSNGATGTATLDLRGLGSSRTLVLVNGRRLQPGSTFTAGSADINQIPGALVQRVDVVTGGASSTYGADAVAGVVNFIMDTDFEGVQLDISGSGYLHQNRNDFISPLLRARGFRDPKDVNFDGTQWSADLALGGGFDGGRGHAVAYATYRKINELTQGSRDYSACALNAAGTACGGSGTSAIPNFYFYRPTTFARFTGPRGLQPNGTFGASHIYNFAPINHFQRPDQRYTLGAFANYEINESFNPYVEAMYMNDRTVAQIAESGTFFAEGYEIPCNSPLLTPAQSREICVGLLGLDLTANPNATFGTYIGKRNVEGGPRQSRIQHDAFRVVAGLKGAITNNWSYDIYTQYGSSHLTNAYLNDFFGPRVLEALTVSRDANGNLVCASGRAGCVPYNVFQPGGVTPEAAAGLSATGILEGITQEYVTSGFVTGELGRFSPWAASAAQLVVGAEYRKEVYDQLSDQVFEEGSLLGQGGPTPSVAGEFDVRELFTEANIPLIEDSFVQDASLSLGYRFSDYSTAGTTHTYKAAANVTVVPQLRLRGAYNRAVRAPNVVELFTPQTLGLFAGSDPCAGANPEFTAAQCANTGVTAAQYGTIAENPAAQYNAQFGGNINLEPEEADTITAGVIVQPMRNLVLSADYYQIKLAGAVSSIDPQLALTRCGETGDATFCSLINRGPGGTLFLGQAGYVIATSQNLGGMDFRGVDLGADFSHDLGAGRVGLDLNGSYLLKKEFEPLPGDESAMYDCRGLSGPSCFPAPKWRHNLRLSYEFPETWLVSARWRHIGKVTHELLGGQPGIGEGAVAELNREIDGQDYFDLVFQAGITDNFTLTFGANNILDKDPPLIGTGGGGSNANTWAGFYDTLGRYVFSTASIKF